MDPARLRRGRRGGVSPPRHADPGRRVRTGCRAASGLAVRLGAARHPVASGARGIDPSEVDAPAHCTGHRVARHDHLHLRHHGPPKGCVLTHAQLHAEIAQRLAGAAADARLTTGSIDAAFPPARARLARIIQLASCTAGSAPVTRRDAKRPAALLSFRPTFVLSVPYVFEKIYNTANTAQAVGRQGPDLRPGRDHAPSSTARRWIHRRPGPGCCGFARALRPARLRPAPRGDRRPGRTASPAAARRSERASATSSAASASPCSRATA